VRTSDALCRATSLKTRAPPAPRRGLERRPTVRHPKTPHEGLRRARSAGPGVGLGRRAPNGSERLPSARPGPCDPSRLGRARCSLARPSPRTLSLAVNLGHLVKGWRVASSYPVSAAIRLSAPRLGTGKMRLPDFCNRPTTRAPNGLPDSRARAPSNLAVFGSTPIRPRPMASSGSSSRASLDGEPPASASTQPPGTRVSGRGPKRRPDGAPRGPGGAWIESSSALCLPDAVFSTASRACDVASDAFCRGSLRVASAFRPNPPGKPPGPPPPPSRQRRPLRRNQDAFPRRMPSLPFRGLRPLPGSSRARHRSRGFATTSRLLTPFCTPSTRPGS
jgi:hypothetical protein